MSNVYKKPAEAVSHLSDLANLHPSAGGKAVKSSKNEKFSYLVYDKKSNQFSMSRDQCNRNQALEKSMYAMDQYLSNNKNDTNTVGSISSFSSKLSQRITKIESTTASKLFGLSSQNKRISKLLEKLDNHTWAEADKKNLIQTRQEVDALLKKLPVLSLTGADAVERTKLRNQIIGMVKPHIGEKELMVIQQSAENADDAAFQKSIKAITYPKQTDNPRSTTPTTSTGVDLSIQSILQSAKTPPPRT